MEEVDFTESLRLINGIGEKTIADIKRAFDTEDGLVSALIADKVSLRDDVVLKLRRFYDIL